ncbi:MAG: hypothetical protein AAF436_10245, partial [Myxococcota bacterium]
MTRYRLGVGTLLLALLAPGAAHRASAGAFDDIRVSRQAQGARAVSVLERSHRTVTLTETTTHTIVAPEDLDDPAVAPLLRAAYARGFAVAVTSVSRDAVSKLAELAGARSYTNLRDLESPTRGQLTILRRLEKSEGPEQRIQSAWVELEDAENPGDAGAETEWLRDRFVTTRRPDPEGGQTLCQDPSTCLSNLSHEATFEAHACDPAGNAITVANQVYSTRSFLQQIDYYLVTQTVTNTGVGNEPDGSQSFTYTQNNAGPAGSVIVDNTPASTVCTGTVVTQQTYTLGFTSGVSGFVARGGIQFMCQTRTECSSLVVFNRSSRGQANYEYVSDDNDMTTTFVATNAFIITVPLGDEPSEVGFSTKASITNGNTATELISVSSDATSQTLDFPFPTKEPEPPTVSGVTDLNG